MKTCPICKKEYPETVEYFYVRPKRSDLAGYCRFCANNLATKRITLQRQELKKEAISLKGGKCSICGFNKSIWSLSFHHLDQNKKDYQISNIKSLERLKSEINKCILVCTNCHQEIHDGLHPEILDIGEGVNNDSTQRRRIRVQEYTDYLGGKCIQCGYSKCNRSLNFHHIGNKEIPIGSLTFLPKLSKMKNELDKCVLLCANCHQIEHEKERAQA